MTRTVLGLLAALTPVTAYAEDKPPPLELRLTLSSLLYRETGADAPSLIDQGATLDSASPVRRAFGDLRLELTGEGVAVDARVRQTTSQRFQSGVDGGGEYELRRLAYQLGGDKRSLVIGRQYVDDVGGSKIDGLAVRQRLAPSLAVVAFGGAFPVLGSRSIDHDYPTIQLEDGTDGQRLIPIAGGLGFAIQTGAYHGNVGAAAVYVPQTVPLATSQETSRVFTTASGYARAGTLAEVYHYLLLDVAGQTGGALTNGSVGVTLHPTAAVQLGVSASHVGSDTLQIAARNLLEDPDPSAMGIVQNNIAVVRVAQDSARAVASLAMSRRRFELSVSGGVRRRPEVRVDLADGTGAVAFPEARNVDASVNLLDRRSLAGMRLALGANLTYPLGDGLTATARGTTLRASASRSFAQERGEVELDVMAGRFHTTGGTDCTTSLDPLACYGATRTQIAQVGVLATSRVSREWLLLADVHVGHRTLESTSLMGVVDWPAVYSVSGYLRAQWRFR